MYSPSKAKKARKPPVSRRRENLANWRVMGWLDEERQSRGLSDRQVGARLGHRNGSRVRQYLKQRIVAGPEVLGRLAIAIGVSPIDALWRAQHYEAVFDYLGKLYRLGWSWMRKDRVGFDQSFGSTFTAFYATQPGGFPKNVDLEIVPATLRSRYHHIEINNPAGIYTKISLVKPIAWAILLGVGLFPRRGDKVRSETGPLIEQLAIMASASLPVADVAQAPPELMRALRRPLKEAEKILPLRFYGSMRLAVVAEYVHSWCDIANAAYANYARLVLYKQGAFVREPGEVEDIWEWQRADFPTISDLRVQN